MLLLLLLLRRVDLGWHALLTSSLESAGAVFPIVLEVDVD